jgi:hypothetical protein
VRGTTFQACPRMPYFGLSQMYLLQVSRPRLRYSRHAVAFGGCVSVPSRVRHIRRWPDGAPIFPGRGRSAPPAAPGVCVERVGRSHRQSAPKTLCILGSWLSPSVRRTNALARVCPALMGPLNMSFAPKNVSASSISTVERQSSIDRNKAAGVTLATGNGQRATAWRTCVRSRPAIAT